MTKRLAVLAGISDQDVVFLAGSTQEPEEELALDTYRTLASSCSRLRLVLVPRHPTRCDDVARLLDRSALPWQRRSVLERDGADPSARVLLVDTVGELGAWWGTAEIAFVGGSMGERGGQNMIEPAAYGAAVSFGPNTRNFRDVVALLRQHQAAIVVTDGQQLTEFVKRCLQEPDWAESLGQQARQLVIDQRGATQRTLALLESVLKVDARLDAGHATRSAEGPPSRQMARSKSQPARG
jgi:3-deoxy-D-manno-octulosonic-acid transferase